MSKSMEGYSYQEYEPTPDKPCEIKCKNLMKGNIQHNLSVPDNMWIGITQEQYREYLQFKKIRETAINYIDQVIMYKPCAREIDEELNTLIGILRGGNNE